MTTTKELLLQSFTKSRKAIQEERKALHAYVSGNVGKIPSESAVFAIRGAGVYDEIDSIFDRTIGAIRSGAESAAVFDDMHIGRQGIGDIRRSPDVFSSTSSIIARSSWANAILRPSLSWAERPPLSGSAS